MTDAVTHQALVGVSVEVFRSTGTFAGSGATDSMGHYAVGGLGAGGYKIGFVASDASHVTQYYNGRPSLSSADPVALSSGQTLPNIDAALEVGGQITGSVTDAATGAAVASTFVTVYDSQGDFAAEATTDQTGHYTALALPSGNYTVGFSGGGGQVYGEQFFNGKTSQGTGDPVSVIAGRQTQNVNAAMRPEGMISGSVTDAVTHAAPPSIEVDAYDTSGRFVSSTSTDSNGGYSIGGLMAGSYRVGFLSGFGGADYARQFYNARTSLAGADQVAVTAGRSTPNINATLAPGGHIAGTVTAATTQSAIQGIEVDVYDATGRFVATATTDGSGHYAVGGLGTATYKLGVVDASSGGYLAEFYDGRPTIQTADGVPVTAGATTPSINFAMQLGGSITGVVTDALSGAPASSVDVSLYDAAGSVTTLASTDAAGRYSITGLATGDYRVDFTAGRGLGYDEQFFNAKPTLASADVVAVTAGRTSAGTNAAMRGGGVVRGTVTDATTHAAIGGVNVSLYDVSGDYVTGSVTDTAGHYALGGVAAGAYDVAFSDPVEADGYLLQFYNGKPSLASADAIVVSEGQQTTGVDAALRVGARIGGTVSDATSHAPVSGILVEVYNPGQDVVTSTETDSSGHYTTGGLAGGTYKVGFFTGFSGPNSYVTQFYSGKASFAAADGLTVTPGQTVQSVDAAMTSGGQISGTVTDASTAAGVAGAAVTVYDASNQIFVGSAQTDSGGHYTVSRVSTGNYKVSFTGPGGGNYVQQYYNGKGSFATADTVAVTAGQIAGNIDAALAAGARLTGIVTDADSGSGIPSAQVYAYNANQTFAGSAATDASGRYTVNGLATGSYKVQFNGFGGAGNYVPQYYSAKPSFGTADPVSATAGQTVKNVDAALAPGAQISGIVTDAATTAGVAGVQVTVYDATQGGSTGPTGTTGAQTDSTGHYTVSRLPAGRYAVGFNSFGVGTNNYLPQFYNGKSTLAAADPVTLAGGQSVSNVGAALDAGGQITGSVTDGTTSSALANVLVYVYDASQRIVASALTDSAGRYTAARLTGGAYRVAFNPFGQSSGYAPQFFDGKSSLAAADPVSVTVGQTTSNINAALARKGQITGTVTDASTSAAVSGVTVRVYDLNSTLVRSAVTDAAGHYTVGGLSGGSYKVGFSVFSNSGNYLAQYYNGESTYGAADAVGVTTDQTTANVNAALTPAAQISGTVTEAGTGAAVSGIQVTVYGAGQTFSGAAQTDASGHYVVSGLADGSYKVGFAVLGSRNYLPQYYSGKASFGASDSVGTTHAQPANNIDAALLPGGQIAGTVTDATTRGAVGGAELTIYDSNQNYVTSSQADASGQYVASALPTGSYREQIYDPAGGHLPQFYNAKPTLSAADQIAVTAGQVTQAVDPVLAPAGKISGTVTDTETSAGISGIQVDVYGSGGGFVASAFTNAAGQYTAGALPGGNYKVGFATASGVYGAQYFDGRSTFGLADAVEVTVAQTTTAIDAGLTPLPVNTSRPTVSGRAQQDETLSAQPGTWTHSPTALAYEWERCAATGSSCDPLGATDRTYVLSPADVGFRIAVVETATNAGGSVSASSAATDVVVIAPPKPIAAPTIIGVARQGDTLTEQRGTWSNQPTSYAVQWLHCDSVGAGCTAIATATGQSYVPVAGDVGHRLEVRETATNAGGDGAPADSQATAVVTPPVPVSTAPPTIAGSAKQGQSLSEVHGTWSNSPTDYAYQWSRCDVAAANCAEIPGASGRSFVLTALDVGHTLVVAETAANAGGAGAPTTSQATGLVEAVPPANTRLPTISGTAQQGETLTEEHGTWTNEPSGYAYSWSRCDDSGGSCSALAGVTGQTYTPVAEDVGHRLEVTEIASNPGGPSLPADSVPTAVVVPPIPTVIAPPTVSGRAVQGETLAEQHGLWTNDPTGYSYQWSRCDGMGTACLPIQGATGQTFALTETDVGHALSVQEIASNAGGSSSLSSSSATDPVVAAPPVSLSAPEISGTAEEGEQLTEVHGSWANSPTSYSYDWQRCDAAGANCASIVTATSQGYVPVTADVGNTLKVLETASNGAGPATPAASPVTAIVVPPVPTNTTLPTISGPAAQGETLSAARGSWTNAPTSYEDQWQRCDTTGCGAISGATGQTYTTVADDVGHPLAVQEIAVNAGGRGAAAVSAHTFAIRPVAPVNVGPPSISGVARQGATLTAGPGTWTNSPTGYAYVWLQCDASATNCAAIDGATGKTYLLPVDAVGHTIEVQETASDAGGAGTPATSPPTGAVSGPAPVANAGDPIVTVVGASVTLDGAASTPAAAIDDYHWDFGDQQTGSGATVTHAYTTPGTYAATLTVTAAGSSDSATTRVTVSQAPATPGVAVQVTGGGANLAGADALIILSDGTRVGAATDGSGTAHLAPVPDGSYTVYAWADGYRPGTARVQVQGGVASTSVELTSGRVVSATLQSHRLDRSEIIAAGIDPNDPANQNVYQFAVHLAFVDSDAPLSGYVNRGGFVGAGGGGGGGGWACSPALCTGTFGGYRYTVGVRDVGGRPTLVWLVVPGKAGFLKEFFDVTMVIQNLADPAFTFSGGQASLNLPTGLSLAPTSTPQQATQAVKDVAGGDTAATTWVVRGDTEGDYFPTAAYVATLQPIGTPVSIQAGLEKPLHVWGGSALTMTVDADATAIAHHPYRVRIGLTNVADIPVYNPSVALLETGRVNYIYQPRERLDQGTDEIAPGETFWANYILVPEISGELDLTRSFIQQTAGNVTLKSAITSHPVVDALDLKVTEMKNKIGLSWVPLPGATDYEVYTTPNPDTAFGPAPATAEMLGDDNGRKRAVVRNVPDGSTAWYAVSPIVDGQPVMSHPLVSATPSSTVNSPTVDTKYSWPSDSEHMCAVNGVARGTITYTFRDEFFAVSDYVITKGGVVQTNPSFTPGHEVTATVDVSLIDGQTLTVTAQPTNSDGDKTFVRTIQLDTKCEQQTAVVVAMGLFSSLGTDGSDAPPESPNGWLSQNCPNGPTASPDPTGTDGFNEQVAVNACDGGNKPTANLLGYLRSKGYDPGAKRSDPNRTMLEFSYNGVVVDCPRAGPTFTPLPYTSDDTVAELLGDVSIDGQAAASGYLDGLEAYNDCWKLRHGRSLEFTVIGHSLGGYEALQLARLAAARHDTGLIRDIVTVDGAIQQYMVPFEFQAGDCKLPNDSWARLPADVAQSLALDQWTPTYQADLWALHKSNSELVRQQIQAIQAAGIDVATVTNHYDTCLHEDATINDAANQTAIFRIQEKGWTGVEAHGAALRAHRLAAEDPGYPLTSFLDSKLYVIDQGVYFPRETGSAATAVAAVPAPVPAPAPAAAPSALRAAPLAATSSAVGGRIQGRVLWADTRTPVSDAHVVAVGGDPFTDGSGAADGTFAIGNLAAGEYKLHIASASGKGGGVWVGGASEAAATRFTVGEDTVDAGDVLIPRPVRLTVLLVSPGGAPISDGVALLFDAADREAAVGQADSQGRVELSAPAGAYTLGTASASTKTLTRTADLTSDISVQVVEPAGLSVGGTLKGSDGAPVPDVMTALYSGAALQSVGFSDANGRFSFVDVASGDYSVHLFEPLDRFVLPNVELPVSAVLGDPAAGLATFEVGHTPVLSSGPPPGTALVAAPYSFDFTASGASDGAFAVRDGQLPDGLTLSTDGRLRGTPRTPGLFKFRIGVANSFGATGGGPFSISVDQQPTFSSAAPPDGRVGSAYAFTIQASGSPPPSFVVTSGSLPAGLTLDPGGSLHGTPTSEGSSSFGVTASNAVGSATSTYAVRVVGLPASTAPPTVSGTVRSGETLTEANGSWTNSPTSFAYRWQDCDASGGSCVAIASATGQTYVLAASDVGHTVRVVEVASNGSGPGSPASSVATGVVAAPPPRSTSLPTIGGVATQGRTLTEANGSWTDSPTSFAYQWQGCDTSGSACAAIADATGQTYVLAASDVGRTIRVVEDASNASGGGVPVSSAATGVVAPPPPGNTSPPTISGAATQGGSLTEAHGSWTNGPTSFAYQWEVCDSAATSCSPIPSATGQTYVTTATDVGHAVRVEESATNAGGTGGPAVSAATAVVPAATVPTAPAIGLKPSITGVPAVGRTLSCSPGTWSGTTPQTYAYQWLRDGAAIPGATGGTHTVPLADAGHAVSCLVTASNRVGNAAAASTAVRVQIPAITSEGGVASVGRAVASGTAASTVVTCAGAAAARCAVALEMTVTETIKAGRLIAVSASSRHATSGTKPTPASTKHTVAVGKTTATLAGGQRVTMRVALNIAGRRLLAGRHRLAVNFTASQIKSTGTNVIAPSQTVRFTTTASKARRGTPKRRP